MEMDRDMDMKMNMTVNLNMDTLRGKPQCQTFRHSISLVPERKNGAIPCPIPKQGNVVGHSFGPV
jgi:hypothetical protein